MQAARYWEGVDAGKIHCTLCPHGCTLGEGQTGRCHVRTVEDGALLSAGYGLISSAQVDPIEKKPLYHFCPGEEIFSIGGWGCNFACVFCQNWTISQQVIKGHRTYTPEQIISKAQQMGGIGIAYTYNEPLVSIEFVRDCAELARQAGLKNVLVTNGYINPEPAAELLPFIDALNVDVKSMDDAFYVKKCRGHVQPVIDLAEQAHAEGCHLEITNLIIPGCNDDDALVESLATWMATALGPHTPLHLSAYRPQFKLEIPATTAAQLVRARELALEHLAYVYLGNVLSSAGQDTVCPGCGATLISRRGYCTGLPGIADGLCAACRRPADIITRS